jgi:integrase
MERRHRRRLSCPPTPDRPSRSAFTAAQSTIDGVLTLSPAEHVRRPNVPRESPTLGLTHLQFEAILTTARLSTNRDDFALVAMLGLLGLRIFEACGADISDLGEDHGHRVLRVTGKGAKVVVLTPPTSCGPNHRPRHRRKNCGPLAD